MNLKLKNYDKNKENTTAIIINDIIRLLVIYWTAHVIEVSIAGTKEFCNKTFILTIISLITGIIIYHSCIKQFLFFDDEI